MNLRRQLYFAFGIIVLGGLICAVIYSLRTKPSLPSLMPYAIPSNVDFGEIVVPSTVSRFVEIRNPSNVEVNIKSVKASCSCVTASIDETTIPPGGVIRSQLQITTNSREIIEQSVVYVIRAGASENSIRIPIRGHTTQALQVIPEFLRIDATPEPNTEIIASLQLTNIQTDTQLGRVRCSLGGSKIAIVSLPSPGHRRLDVVLPSETPGGPLEGDVVIEYTYKGLEGRITVPVLGDKEGIIEIMPKSVNFGLISGRTKELSVQIKSNDGLPFRIMNAICSDNRVSVQYSSTTASQHSILFQTRRNANGEMTIRDDVIIFLDHPKASTWRIPVRGLIMKSDEVPDIGI